MEYPMRQFKSASDNGSLYVRHHISHDYEYAISTEDLEALRKRAYKMNPYKNLTARANFRHGVDKVIDKSLKDKNVKEQPSEQSQPEQTPAPSATPEQPVDPPVGWASWEDWNKHLKETGQLEQQDLQYSVVFQEWTGEKTSCSFRFDEKEIAVKYAKERIGLYSYEAYTLIDSSTHNLNHLLPYTRTRSTEMEEARAAYDRAMDACLQEPFN